jgi:glycosyltransferase involved in cell wall biosynthesis
MPEPLRVLFAIGEMSGGGSQQQLLGILRRLNRDRFKPYLYALAAEGELLAEVPPDVPVYLFAKRHANRVWFLPDGAYRARIRDLASILNEQRIDVVYDRTYHMTLVTAGATRRRPTPRASVIVTDPQLDFETNPERFRFIKRLLLKRSYRSADQVVAVSEGVRKAAISYYGLSPAKTLTLYNFFDIERIDRLAAEPVPESAVRDNDQRFEIVAAGRLHPQKGFVQLIGAVAELVHHRLRRQIHLRILGDGLQETALRYTIARYGLNDHVTLAGFVANPLPYFRQANLFCLSSLYEGMPNALVEAMLCQVPVLATDCPSGPAEILAGGKYGRLVLPGSSRALADAINDAILNPQHWQMKIAPARAHIERTFSTEEGIRRVEELLLRVAASRPTSQPR